MTRVRLFVAVNLPPDMRSAIWAAIRPLRDAGFPVRWVGSAELHLTLSFLGDVEGSEVAGLEAGLREVTRKFPSLRIRVEGVGAFPSLRHPRVLWLGVEAPPVLRLLYHAVETVTEAQPSPRKRRAFHPHITLGRVRSRVRPSAFRGLDAAARGVSYGADCEVTQVALMRSELGQAGARYSMLCSFPLDASPATGRTQRNC